MKIRKKLTLRYTSVTAIILVFILGFIYLFSKDNREREFFRDLKQEAITKANLFLDNRVDDKTMQSIYLNNREFINEVEVAIYSENGTLLYHDAIEIDIVKETAQMIESITHDRTLEFYQDEFQAIGIVYTFSGKNYVITAAAYDGYGYAKLKALAQILILSFFIGLAILFIVGYYLSKSALSPVSKIVKQAQNISAKNLDERLPVAIEQDELDELSASFNAMLNRIEKAFEAQTQFVSNVSHELKTPMAALITELEITLLKERTSKEYIEACENALKDAKGINKLAEGLLNLAKANYLPEKIKMQEVRLDEILLDARTLVLKANPTHKIEIIFEEELEDEGLITVIGNEYLLRTAFVNLIENNCKFSDNNASLIQISSWEGDAVVRLSDSGKGIAPDDLKYVFNPFFRGKEASTVQGYGIGLALCKNIVQIHHGVITISSDLNVGTTYTVSLPNLVPEATEL